MRLGWKTVIWRKCIDVYPLAMEQVRMLKSLRDLCLKKQNRPLAQVVVFKRKLEAALHQKSISISSVGRSPAQVLWPWTRPISTQIMTTRRLMLRITIRREHPAMAPWPSKAACSNKYHLLWIGAFATSRSMEAVRLQPRVASTHLLSANPFREAAKREAKIFKTRC